MTTIYKCPECGLKVPMRDNEFPFRCRCGFRANAPADFFVFRSSHQIRRKKEVSGVGTELVKLLHELGITPKTDCQCASRAMEMNGWGIEGCERNEGLILQWLEEGYHKATWLEVFKVGSRGYFSFASILQEAVKRYKNWKSLAYVNLDRIGWGDMAIFSYIAEGTKDSHHPLVMCATGERARHIRMLGQEPGDPALDTGEWNAFSAECEEGMVTPRLQFYAEFYAVPNTPKRPTLTLPEEYEDWAAGLGITKKTVLCFPDSLAKNRRWPTIYWDMLTDQLEACGLKTLVFPIHEFEKYKNSLEVKPLAKVVACMKLAGLAVGIDSALMNWTPLVDLPAIALLGPTRAPIFAHAPLIRTLAADPEVMPCTGCCYFLKHNPWCKEQCMSLSNLTPAAVSSAVLSYHQELHG